MVNLNLLKSGAEQIGIELSSLQEEQFLSYAKLLVEWNEKMNLTAICDPDGIAVKHFLDSILPLPYVSIREGASVADIGTGAGFPGLPIKIIRPDIKLTLVDSLNKRITFLKEVCNVLGLENVEFVHGRAEDLGKDKKYREKFDTVVSRAVSNMTVLGEYCLPFVAVGGQLIALKAEDADAELSEAKPMLGNLGGAIGEVLKKPLPESDIIRTLVVVDKTKNTPPQFPRTAKRIQKGK